MIQTTRKTKTTLNMSEIKAREIKALPMAAGIQNGTDVPQLHYALCYEVHLIQASKIMQPASSRLISTRFAGNYALL